VARAAKHSKAVVEEPVPVPSVAAPVVVSPVVAEPVSIAVPPAIETVSEPAPAVEAPVAAVSVKTVSQEEIARLAYCYWADRGYQGGSPQEDWARAEQVLMSQL